MSHLPGEALTYQTVIAEFFLGLRGGGLMLSPLDLELVQSWERRGLPVAVVCRGLRRGLEEAALQRGPSAPAPRSLRACRLAVEDEWTSYRRGRVGDAPPPPDEGSAAARRLEAARAMVASEATRGKRAPGLDEAYRRAAALLAVAPGGLRLDAVDALVEQVDTALLRGWLAGLDRATRSRIGRTCVRTAGPRAPWTRRGDYRSAVRSELLEEARRAGLLCLRGSV